MKAPTMTATCGWCPTPLPHDDPLAIETHFLTQHRVTGHQSLRYHYPDGDELEQMWARPVVSEGGQG